MSCEGVASEVFKPGNHASTFGGNPLASTAALTTLNIIERDGLILNALELGDYIRSSFKSTLSSIEGVKEIRGQGLMIGIELSRPCGELVREALSQGLLINVTSDKVVRLLPPSDETSGGRPGGLIRIETYQRVSDQVMSSIPLNETDGPTRIGPNLTPK